MQTSPSDHANGAKLLHRALEPISRWLRIPVSTLYVDLRLDTRHNNANCRKLISLAEVTILCRTKKAVRTLAPLIVCDGHLSPHFRTVNQAQAHVRKMAASLSASYAAQCRSRFLRLLLEVTAETILGRKSARRWFREPSPRLAGRKPSEVSLQTSDGFAVVDALRDEYREEQQRTRTPEGGPKRKRSKNPSRAPVR